MNLTRTARMLLISAVCGVVFWGSANHEIWTATDAGNTPDVAWTYPVAIDAMILACALTVVARAGMNWRAKAWASFGRYFGFAATIYCNLTASGLWARIGADASVIHDAVIMLMPAVSLIVTIEVMVHGWRGTTGTRARKAKAAGNVTPIRRTA